MKLDFKPRAGVGIQARHDFPNGYGVSVVQGPCTYGNKLGLYELAVMFNGRICYTTPITQDVIGYLTLEQAEQIADEVAALGDFNELSANSDIQHIGGGTIRQFLAHGDQLLDTAHGNNSVSTDATDTNLQKGRPMKIHKVTTGFVTQVFDTITNKFICQDFTAGDEVVYESEDGQHCDEINEYLPFEMIQPDQMEELSKPSETLKFRLVTLNGVGVPDCLEDAQSNLNYLDFCVSVSKFMLENIDNLESNLFTTHDFEFDSDVVEKYPDIVHHLADSKSYEVWTSYIVDLYQTFYMDCVFVWHDGKWIDWTDYKSLKQGKKK